MTSVNRIRYIATVSQVMALTDNDTEHLWAHLSHSGEVFKRNYQQWSTFIEKVVNVVKIMLMQEFNLVAKFKGRRSRKLNLTQFLVMQ